MECKLKLNLITFFVLAWPVMLIMSATCQTQTTIPMPMPPTQQITASQVNGTYPNLNFTTTSKVSVYQQLSRLQAPVSSCANQGALSLISPPNGLCNSKSLLGQVWGGIEHG